MCGGRRGKGEGGELYDRRGKARRVMRGWSNRWLTQEWRKLLFYFFKNSFLMYLFGNVILDFFPFAIIAAKADGEKLL